MREMVAVALAVAAISGFAIGASVVLFLLTVVIG
jgi:hypothetical protein